MTLSTVCTSLPYLAIQMIMVVSTLNNNLQQLAQDNEALTLFCGAFYSLGMGLNSNIFLFRSSEIMKLMKKKMQRKKPQTMAGMNRDQTETSTHM